MSGPQVGPRPRENGDAHPGGSSEPPAKRHEPSRDEEAAARRNGNFVGGFIGGMGMHSMIDGLSSASWLIGTWTGNGKGAFAHLGGEEFYYCEEATFVPVVGRSAIMYSQRTWREHDHVTLHHENGFFRLGTIAGGPGRVQLVVSQVTGLNYVCEGDIGEYMLEMQSTEFSTVSNVDGPPVTLIRRRFFLRSDNSLGYTVDIATGTCSELLRCREATLMPLATLALEPPLRLPPGVHGPGHNMCHPSQMGRGGEDRPRKGARNVPTPPRKDWGRLKSFPNGKITVEVMRDKFDGDAICIQCRDMESTWDRSAWINCTFVDSQNMKHKMIQVSFEDKCIGRVYEIRAKVMGGQPTTAKQGGTLVVRAGDSVQIDHTMTEEDLPPSNQTDNHHPAAVI